MKNRIISIPIGIIKVLWDIDEYDAQIKEAFYEFTISINENEKYEFSNNYFFLTNKICTLKDKTSSYVCNFRILEEDDCEIKIEFCGDIIFLNKKQYKLLNESLGKSLEKYNFDIKYSK